MTTLKVGIASYEEMKDRTMAVARSERRIKAGEPKVWFTSTESFAKVLSAGNRELLRVIAEKEPSVPPQGGDHGEMGRRLKVRWDLTTGTLTPDFVVELPPDARPNPGVWRLAISTVPDPLFMKLERTRVTGSA